MMTNVLIYFSFDYACPVNNSIHSYTNSGLIWFNLVCQIWYRNKEYKPRQLSQDPFPPKKYMLNSYSEKLHQEILRRSQAKSILREDQPNNTRD